MKKILERLRYLYYSKEYRKKYPKEMIDKIKNAKLVYFARQNGKTYLSMEYFYIKLVENHFWELARYWRKSIKKLYGGII